MQDNKVTLVPFLLILAFSAIAPAYYFASVDAQWFTQTVVFAGSDVSAAEAAQTQKMLSQDVLLIGGALSSVFASIITIVALSVYFLLVSKIDGTEKRFAQWFQFATWGQFPIIIAAILTCVLVFFADGDRISYNVLSASSMNALFFQFPAQHEWASLLDTVSLIHLIQIGLMSSGYSVWSKKSFIHSLSVVSLPYLLIASIWALSI